MSSWPVREFNISGNLGVQDGYAPANIETTFDDGHPENGYIIAGGQLTARQGFVAGATTIVDEMPVTQPNFVVGSDGTLRTQVTKPVYLATDNATAPTASSSRLYVDSAGGLAFPQAVMTLGGTSPMNVGATMRLNDYRNYATDTSTSAPEVPLMFFACEGSDAGYATVAGTVDAIYSLGTAPAVMQSGASARFTAAVATDSSAYTVIPSACFGYAQAAIPGVASPITISTLSLTATDNQIFLTVQLSETPADNGQLRVVLSVESVNSADAGISFAMGSP